MSDELKGLLLKKRELKQEKKDVLEDMKRKREAFILSCIHELTSKELEELEITSIHSITTRFSEYIYNHEQIKDCKREDFRKYIRCFMFYWNKFIFSFHSRPGVDKYYYQFSYEEWDHKIKPYLLLIKKYLISFASKHLNHDLIETKVKYKIEECPFCGCLLEGDIFYCSNCGCELAKEKVEGDEE